mmetsp:Transcript_74642/g.207481  ORF Transcript_74642/g.207481 Transcript_74642/m.207481 type:complete len:475 (+) Transcript_74642:57-1481(+)
MTTVMGMHQCFGVGLPHHLMEASTPRLVVMPPQPARRPPRPHIVRGPPLTSRASSQVHVGVAASGQGPYYSVPTPRGSSLDRTPRGPLSTPGTPSYPQLPITPMPVPAVLQHTRPRSSPAGLPSAHSQMTTLVAGTSSFLPLAGVDSFFPPCRDSYAPPLMHSFVPPQLNDLPAVSPRHPDEAHQDGSGPLQRRVANAEPIAVATECVSRRRPSASPTREDRADTKELFGQQGTPDVVDQQVEHFLHCHPQVARKHKVLRKGFGVYEVDGHEVWIEWQHAATPTQGYLVVVDGPLRQPFADYMAMTEANAFYDSGSVAKTIPLHHVPKEKRMTFDDKHQRYDRLDAMKVAKEQALIRERAASFVNEGRGVPIELVEKYNRSLQRKLGKPASKAEKAAVDGASCPAAGNTLACVGQENQNPAPNAAVHQHPQQLGPPSHKQPERQMLQQRQMLQPRQPLQLQQQWPPPQQQQQWP